MSSYMALTWFDDVSAWTSFYWLTRPRFSLLMISCTIQKPLVWHRRWEYWTSSSYTFLRSVFYNSSLVPKTTPWHYWNLLWIPTYMAMVHIYHHYCPLCTLDLEFLALTECHNVMFHGIMLFLHGSKLIFHGIMLFLHGTQGSTIFFGAILH